MRLTNDVNVLAVKVPKPPDTKFQPRRNSWNLHGSCTSAQTKI
jgi:hypothetical protein